MPDNVLEVLLEKIINNWRKVYGAILGFIVGSQVSGIDTYNSIFFSIPVGNKDLISGGKFGFEASIIETILELAISLFVIYLIKKEKNKINF